MSNVRRSLSRALPLITLAGLLVGCPAVEPIEPEPVQPAPRSGVWGLHIAELHADGMCADFAPAIEGRVVRLDIDAEDSGELVAGVLGLDMFGGHNDGFVWADAELPLPWWGYGWEDPVICEGDEDVDEGIDGSPGEDVEEPPCAIYVGDEDEEYCELPEPEPELDAGIYVSLNAELRHSEAMQGDLIVTVSNGWAACSFEAIVDAAYLGEDADFGDDDVSILPVEPGEPGEPLPMETEGHPAED